MRGACALAVLSAALVAAPQWAPAAHAAEAAPPPSRTHEIKKGDTLGALARRYGISVAAIVRANRLPRAGVVLKPGQRLVIPAATSAAGKPGDNARQPPLRHAAIATTRPAPPQGPRAPGFLVLAIPDFADPPPAFLWPADGPVTSAFGRRRSTWHRGIDIKAEQGTPVQAAAAGVVIASGVEPRYGKVIKVEHEGGFVTIYAHNDDNRVDVGARVAAGETIATVGRTGRAMTHHVHFEIRRDGRNYNPLYLLPLPPRIARVEETDENPPDDE